MRHSFTWSPVTTHHKILHRFYKRTILSPLNLAKVFTVQFIQIYLTITFVSTTTSSKFSPLMMIFQTHSSNYFLVFRSFCLSCPFHNSHFIHLKYKKLKVIELEYVAPPRPNRMCELKNKKPNRSHLLFHCTSYRFNMFRALLYPSSGARDYDVDYHIGRVVLGLLYVGG